MTPRRVGAAGICVLVCMSAFVGSAQAGSARADLDRASAKPSEFVTVTGAGWQPGTIVVVEVCGNEALDGAVDCAPSTATDIGVQPDGSFSTLVPVVVPPSPCPCVVQVTSTNETTELRLPLEVIGAPTAPPLARSAVPDIRRHLEVTQAELRGSSFSGWFGFPARRTLVVEVVNKSDVALHDVAVAVTAGKGDAPTGYVDAGDIANIEPGETHTLRIPVSFDPLQFGELTVAGSIGGAVEPVRFGATTTNPPVLPVLLALLVAQWLLLKVRNRLRRRAERLDEEPPADAEPDEQGPIGPSADDEVLDLTEPAPDDVPVVVELDEPAEENPTTPDPEPEPVDVALVDTTPIDTAEARILRRRAEQVAEALIAASAARSQELEERAARAEAEANGRLLEALEILDRADARAIEIQEAAAAVAADTLRRAARQSVEVPRAGGFEDSISNAVSKALAEVRLPTGID